MTDEEIDYHDIGQQLAAGLADSTSAWISTPRGTVFVIGPTDVGEFLIGSTWALASWNDLEKYDGFHRSGDPAMVEISTAFCFSMDWGTLKPRIDDAEIEGLATPDGRPHG